MEFWAFNTIMQVFECLSTKFDPRNQLSSLSELQPHQEFAGLRIYCEVKDGDGTTGSISLIPRKTCQAFPNFRASMKTRITFLFLFFCFAFAFDVNDECKDHALSSMIDRETHPLSGILQAVNNR